VFCARKKFCFRLTVAAEHYIPSSEPVLATITEAIFPFEWRHRLWGQGRLLKFLEEKIIDVSICGHRHEQGVDVDDDGRGEICIGSVTKSSIGLNMY